MMNKTTILLLQALVVVSFAHAQATKPFPERWGKPPAIETRDYVEWPGGYGHGSSTLAKWIARNLEKDAAGGGGASQAAAKALYENNFEKTEAGKVPEELMVLSGDFIVKSEGGNKFLELPGSPLDTFCVLFGPAVSADVSVSARIFGTAKGRRQPTFAVGLGGASGYKLRVSPGKKMLELLKDEDIQAGVPFEWKSGTWTALRLQLRKVKTREWKIEGKAWEQGTPEPAGWGISLDEASEPLAGKASLVGCPFAGTPIEFDDLVVSEVKPKP